MQATACNTTRSKLQRNEKAVETLYTELLHDTALRPGSDLGGDSTETRCHPSIALFSDLRQQPSRHSGGPLENTAIALFPN